MDNAADGDLLFGLLALQNGLIDQDQLLAAFRAWSLDRARSLADHLDALGQLDTEGRAAVEAMAALHRKRHGGDAAKSLASLPTGRSVRERLAALGDPELSVTVARLGSGSTERDGDADRTASYAAGPAAEGQRFRVLRPHAKGGLGAVFVALDAELNREVALKQILDHHADDPTSRTRFLLEAEITGGLEHPGIVPVYGLGCHRGGRPYYAMRFIRGDSLKEAIARLHADEALKADPGRRSLALRKLLRRFLDVCNAIDYAHGRGVLHRDIKPSNVVLGKHGETLVVDWGLAKLTEAADPSSDERTLMPSSASGSAETLPGAAMGTPQYMSPEQAVGDLEHLGPRGDVYSLGATLYCLLTGRPAFDGDVGEVLRAVQKGEFPPPRKLDPTIDRALEAVCLKAMALDPEGRYATAKALADDVERWMADEPVSAWREPFSRRARRWLSRNRTLVAASAAAVVLAAAGLAGMLAVQRRANRDLEVALWREAQAHQAALASRESSNRRFELARTAVESFYTGASEDVILKRPELRELRGRLLRTSLTFYQQMAADLQRDPGAGPATDAHASRALAKAVERVADIQWQIGAKPEALGSLRRAEAMYASTPSLVVSKADTAQLQLKVGRLQRQMGRPADALRSVERALATLGEPDPNRDISLLYYYYALMNLGGVRLDLGRPDEALRSLEACRTYYEGRLRKYPQIANGWGDLASCYQWLGYAYQESGRPEEALECHRKELDGQESYRPTGSPNEGDPRARLAQCEIDVGNDLTDLGRLAEARAALERGLAILDERAGAKSVDADLQSERARGHFFMARLLARAGEADAADRHARRAEALLDALEDPSPSDRYRRAALLALRLGLVAPGRSDADLTDGRRAERRRLADQAVSALREAVAHGFRKAHLLESDPDLEPLRPRDDFREVRRRLDEATSAETAAVAGSR